MAKNIVNTYHNMVGILFLYLIVNDKRISIEHLFGT